MARPDPTAPAGARRCVVLGDPQARADAFFAVLARHGLLDPDGSLAAGATLASIGDHFDFIGADPDADAGEGARILGWLAAQDPARVVLLLGNHDTARVQELHAESDVGFVVAQALAVRAVNDAAAAAELRRRFPLLPTPGLVARDYNTFRVAQRELVQRLLLAGRFRLAAVGRLPGGPDLLLTHAGLTGRELDLLGLAGCRDATTIAAALNRFLEARVAAVRAAWTQGAAAPLDLEPLHRAGVAGREGGGLLYHRPANADARARPDADLAWELDPERPRRFHPRELPPGLVQACGHVRHPTSLRELVPWAEPAAAAARPGALRTLLVHGDAITYAARRLAPAAGDACLYLLDGEMRQTPAADYEVLELEALTAP